MPAKPEYVPLPTKPTPHDYGKPVPRVVNAQWLVLALLEQAAATRAGNFLPWEPAPLLRRAAQELANESIGRKR